MSGNMFRVDTIWGVETGFSTCWEMKTRLSEQICTVVRMQCIPQILKAILKVSTFQRGRQLLPPLFGRHEIST